MSNPWKKDQVNMRYNKQMNELLDDEFIQHLQAEYDGFTDFVESALRREKNESKSVDQKIQEKERQAEQLMQELEELRDLKRQRENEKRIQRKKDELRELQKKYKRVQRDGLTSREEAVDKVVEIYSSRASVEGSTEDEIRENMPEGAFEKNVEKRLVDEEELQDLEQQICELQQEIMDLNGGERYDWFIDPEADGVAA